VGAIFGVGFFREYYTAHSKRRQRYVKEHKRYPSPTLVQKPDREEIRKRKLERRSHFLTIITAWVVTVPAAALLAAGIYNALSFVR
jgi:PiT family inorganic phosphate transporter